VTAQPPGAASSGTPTVLALGVDVGSVRRKGGFSWASSDGLLRGEDDPSALGAVVAAALDAGRPVALAFECPLSVPVPGVGEGEWRDLGRARAGEGNRSWSAGAGTGALATGLVQLAWLCRYLVAHCAAAPRTTTQLDRFLSAEADLLVAEAMVTSEGKPEPVDGMQDHADALAAAKRLAEILDATHAGLSPPSDVSCLPHGPLNLAASAALHAGLPIATDELRLDVLIAKVLPVFTG
jgi:hypothetical protein